MTTGGAMSDNEWQRVTGSSITSDNEWQWMATSDNEWQSVTTSGTTNENGGTTNGSKWE